MQVNITEATRFIALVKNPVPKTSIAVSLDHKAAFVMPENSPFIAGKMLENAMCLN